MGNKCERKYWNRLNFDSDKVKILGDIVLRHVKISIKFPSFERSIIH